MSNKMIVRYGVDALPITEAPDSDVVTFIVKDDNDDVIGRQGFDFDEMPDGNRHRIFLYGANKLLTDRTSDDKDKLVKLDNMQGVFDLLMTGEWSKERVVGAIVVSPEVEALAQMQSISVPDVQAALAQYDKDTRKAILGRDDVQAKAKLIRAARKDAPAKTLDDMIPSS